MYDRGYLFTRVQKGVMNQTRSLRIDLSKFNLTSENRRILRKTENIHMINGQLPMSNYDWKIGKLAKDFYETKFGAGTFSANKVKELLTDEKKSNVNVLLCYHVKEIEVGYCIAFETPSLLHYAYPFYQLKIQNSKFTPHTGMGMMLKAILWAKEQGKKYVYLGSATRPTDVYKLQFEGLEWFDGERWNTDLDRLKQILTYHT